MIRLATVGTSGYAGYLMDRLWELPNLCRVVAAATLDKADSPSVLNCTKQGVRVFPNLEAMLTAIDTRQCDAIIVVAGIDSHYNCAAQALAAGFHVLLEKPPVPTIQELDALTKLQQRTKRMTAVHFQFLYADVNQRLKALLASGTLGALRRLRASAVWPRPIQYFQRSGWTGRLRTDSSWVLDGTIGNALAHLLAQQLFLSTAKPGMAAPSSVQAELYRANEINGDDTSAIRLITEEGVEIICCASLAAARQRDVLLEIETEKAVIRQVDFSETVVRYVDGREELLGKPHPSKAEEDKSVRRHMLTTILNDLIQEKPQFLDAAACRPYVVALNAAFDSNGPPKPIAAEFRHTSVSENLQQMVIENIERDLEMCFNQRRLFSELGIPWASASPRFACNGYSSFPTNPLLQSLEPGQLSAARRSSAVLTRSS